MQAENRFLDDLARVATGALGVAAGVRNEAEALLRQRFARLLDDMDLVTREEFEAVKAMAAKARAEQAALAKQLATLEAALAAGKDKAAKTRTAKTRTAKKRMSRRTAPKAAASTP